MPRKPTSDAGIEPDTPLRLEAAAELAFPGQGYTARHLKREFKRGRLTIWFIAGKSYTTVAECQAMLGRPVTNITLSYNRTEGIVYVIGFGPYVKIGFTSRPLKVRIAGMNTGTPEDFIVYGSIPGTFDLERTIHARFAAYRLRREWFRKEGDLTAWIEAGCPE